MGHGITSSDNVAFTGSRNKVWHKIGQEIPTGLSAVEALTEIGLDWDTELLPVHAESTTFSVGDSGDMIASANRIELPDHRAHIRSDTKALLGVVGSGYTAMQNRELAEFADAIAGDDAAITVDTAGSLLGGKRVFFLVKLPHDVKVGADISESYVLVGNGHGGIASMSVYPTSIRVVCRNTMRASERDAAKGISFRHTGDWSEKVKQARTAIGTAIHEMDEFGEKVRALAGCQLSVGQVADFMAMTYDRTFGKLPDPKKDPEAFATLRDKRDTTIAAWIANMDHEFQTVAGIEGTAWAALNAVTQWHDHERGRGDASARINSRLYGAAHTDKRKALNAAMALIAS